MTAAAAAGLAGCRPTTILVRRIKQGVAEWFRLQLKEKTWKGLKEHTTEGWNIGPVPYGYLPDRVPHPSPFKAAQGRTKTRLALDPDRAPVVAQIYTWRTEDKLGVNAIVARLNADPGTYPPADPAAGWSLGGVSAILGNPKYTGYQVFGRRRRGRPVPADQWHWSPAPAHPQIIDRATWDTAQAAGMPDKAADAYRARIRQQFITLYGERETLTAQLDALDKDPGRHGTNPALLDELPELATRLDDLPERLQAELFAAFDIQILWNAPMKQATFFVTITGTTPGIVATLLDRAGDNDTATAGTSTDPDQAPASTSTFSVPTRSGIPVKYLRGQ